MSKTDKPEIFLEMCAGFFRIPTENAIYNITVLGNEVSSDMKVVERIVDVEKGSSPPVPGAVPGSLSPDETAEMGDDYYKKVSSDVFHDIGQLAKSLSSTMLEIPAEDRLGEKARLDQAGEKIEEAKNQLKDIVSMTEHATMEIMDQVEKVQGETSDVRELLSVLKDHEAFNPPDDAEEEGAGSVSEDVVAEVRDPLTRVVELLTALREESPPVPSVEDGGGETVQRYLFDLDPVFQTIYELCTNETVKGHVTDARAQAEEIFNLELFRDEITERVSGLETEDGFLTVPLADVLNPLHEACSDKAVKNLLKKMEQNSDTIFLDQYLPLEMPEIEEPQDDGAVATDEPAGFSVSENQLMELEDLVRESLSSVEGLAPQTSSVAPVSVISRLSGMTLEDQEDIFIKIESAFESVTNINNTIFKITEALSFQDLSGQQIMKIIKLLSDFQIQLLAIVVSFGSQLKIKEENVEISHEDGKSFAQNEVDSYLGKVKAPGDEDKGMLDQDTVNKMLEDLGF
ncbi:protein phosphatase CheZ [Thermodesulfobacteriota bacterium]